MSITHLFRFSKKDQEGKCNSCVEATEEVFNYIIDNALAYSYIIVNKIYAFSPDVANITISNINRHIGGFQLGACDYYLD